MKYKIKEYLQAAGMTSKALANKLGITPTALSMSTAGQNFTIPRLEQIAKIFGCKVSDLLDESTPEESTRSQGIRCPHCGKLLYLATRPEDEPRQTETEPAASPEAIPEAAKVINPEPVLRQGEKQLSIFGD